MVLTGIHPEFAQMACAENLVSGGMWWDMFHHARCRLCFLSHVPTWPVLIVACFFASSFVGLADCGNTVGGDELNCPGKAEPGGEFVGRQGRESGQHLPYY